jgi:1-acyl-sn-glycerol-3-phosphate acyltransferase
MKVLPLELMQSRRSEPRRLWYRFWRGLFHLVAVLLFRFRSRGGEQVPVRGGCLIASNHVSFADPPLVGAACFSREIHFFARKDLFDVPVLGAWMRSVNTIAVGRAQADIGGVREALRVLKSGKALLVFPEGTRTYDGNFREPLAGVGMIVARTGVPVVPARIFGAEKAWPRQKKFPRFAKVTVTVGQPFRFELTEEESRSRETYQAISLEIMRRIAELEP